MPVTLPRSTWAWHSLANTRPGVLITLLSLVCLAAGSPLKREAKTSPRQGSAVPVPRSSERPAAHLEADPNDLKSLTWRTGEDNSFAQGNLTLENNKLCINHGGLYFIYTQVTFGDQECPQDNMNLISLSVILQSFHRNDKMPLLRGDRTPCEQSAARCNNTQTKPAINGNSAGWNKSIFLGAAFKLDKGDKLYVEAISTKYIKGLKGANYFGAYALSECDAEHVLVNMELPNRNRQNKLKEDKKNSERHKTGDGNDRKYMLHDALSRRSLPTILDPGSHVSQALMRRRIEMIIPSVEQSSLKIAKRGKRLHTFAGTHRKKEVKDHKNTFSV
ncbi:lymphotoxin-alpha-like [Leptodactylus fuscus]|uniref:lymphotoxin-alpha-like n=1 Tax=Leptodactylus fuscus TaxID=238119 RepID=UPI003F4F1770